ncbi:MAG: thioredoxin domain-containing protein, partial [Deltaproteobacteria bacterium]|nr:thioredoxin domain-containing protein [Deltaproteobacteria bacterium]
FEDERTAAIMNRYFVNIKVDREERPDLDNIYMKAVQAMTGSGGWPMSVFLTPDGVPFYGGTYFPPVPRYNMPSFRDVLRAVADAWENRREEVVRTGKSLLEGISGQVMAGLNMAAVGLKEETLTAAYKNIQQQFDKTNGGWGSAPKFPQPMILDFLLRYHRSSGNPDALIMVTQTIEAMARGGMYDQLGGGFHRYSVDQRWQVPHFEKMLYDNAQLARVYMHAWQVTGTLFFRTITEEILDYVMREMTDPAGGFYSTQDADSEGREGRFYVWTPDEIKLLLGAEAVGFAAAYGVSDKGNFEGSNILEYRGDLKLRPKLAETRARMLDVREKRVRPGRDEKIITSWNGLMLAAFAEAARLLGRNDYLNTAENNARFMMEKMRGPDGRLLRTWKAQDEQGRGAGKARLKAYLEDYTHFIDGLLELYQTTCDPAWYGEACKLTEIMIRHFKAPNGFYDTCDDHETLVIRSRDLEDNAMPSGNGMAAAVLGKLSGLSMETRYAELAEAGLIPLQPMMGQYPLGFGQWLIALDYLLARPHEIAIVGEPGEADTQALLAEVKRGFRPHQVVAAGPAGSEVPLLKNRYKQENRATAYVCRNFVCRQPVNDPAELRDLLEKPDL